MLTLRLMCVGRMKAGAESELYARYVERAALAGRALGLKVEFREIAESKARSTAARKADEAEALRKVAGVDDPVLVVFDDMGLSIGSDAFAAIIRSSLERGDKALGLVIGGPDGLDSTLRDAATHVVALGAMTWPHQLARIMVAEQMYRAVTILAGHPYHRI